MVAMNTAHAPGPPRRCVLDVSGALIGVELDPRDQVATASFLDVWRDAVVPAALPADRTLFAADHAGLDALTAAIRGAAQEVLRTRDVWAPEAALLADGDRAVLVLGATDDSPVPGERHGPFTVVGRTLVAVDPVGGLRPSRAPVRSADGAALVPPSARDGLDLVPSPLRLAGVLVLDAADRAPALLDLASALPLLAGDPGSAACAADAASAGGARPAGDAASADDAARADARPADVARAHAAPGDTEPAPLFGAARSPLRSLARLLADARVVTLRSTAAEDVSAALGVLAAHAEHDAPEVFAPPAPWPGTSPLHRTGAVDALCTASGRVVVFTAGRDGHRILSLDPEESAVWGGADAPADSAGGPPLDASGSTAESVTLDTRAMAESGHLDAGVPAAGPGTRTAAVGRLRERGLLGAHPVWRIADDAAWAEHADTAVAMDLATPGAAPVALRDSAHSVWQVLVRRRAVARERLLSEIAEEYRVEEDVIAADVDALLATLERARLVVRL